MFTRVKTADEIAAMRESGRMLATVLQLLKKELTSGMTSFDLGERAKNELRAMGGEPVFLGYPGMLGYPNFPSVLCVSINDEVVHGIPKPQKIIAEGDIVSMDFGVSYKGMITDAAISVIVGKAHSADDERLVSLTERSLLAGVDVLHDGVPVGDIAAAIQKVLDDNHLGIVRDLVGHGVGHELHEGPDIPNFGVAAKGPKLQAGMTIAIEPMATLGDYHVNIDHDGWTIKTADGSRSAHFEHTVLVTETGAEILTQL
jgi:methionyl aminopeptidase